MTVPFSSPHSLLLGFQKFFGWTDKLFTWLQHLWLATKGMNPSKNGWCVFRMYWCYTEHSFKNAAQSHRLKPDNVLNTPERCFSLFCMPSSLCSLPSFVSLDWSLLLLSASQLKTVARCHVWNVSMRQESSEPTPLRNSHSWWKV